jgi:hypothetical protein
MFGNLEKPVTFMVRQAHRERNLLITSLPFALSLSKRGVFRGSRLGGIGFSIPFNLEQIKISSSRSPQIQSLFNEQTRHSLAAAV